MSGCGVVVVGLSLYAWLTATAAPYAFALVPFGIALITAIVRWPTRTEAARAADRRLNLEERLATAWELSQRRSVGRFDRLQIDDTLRYVVDAQAALLLQRQVEIRVPARRRRSRTDRVG